MQPSLASLINTNYRTKVLTDLLTKLKADKSLDGQAFWQTREFYYPGSLKYSHDGFKNNEIEPIIKKINVTMKPDNNRIPFLMYRSDKWISADFLVSSSTISDHVTMKQLNNETILKTSTEWIYYEDENTLVIIFTKNIDEMQKSNGYFDYPGHDKEYLKDKYWLSVSTINIEE